jgi:hypothetical protein
MSFCSFHCSGCNRHFASLEAFDLHRVGNYETGRFCIDAGACDRLVVASSDGVCRLTRGVNELRQVAIFRSRRHAEDTDAVLRLRSADRRHRGAQGGVEVAHDSEASARALTETGS